jgi:hypothetical protein
LQAAFHFAHSLAPRITQEHSLAPSAFGKVCPRLADWPERFGESGQLDALLRSVHPADERPAARQSMIQDHAAIVPYLFDRLLLGDPLK